MTLWQPRQCLLAIAYVNDDPKDSTNPNPLVYPFIIRWENNIRLEQEVRGEVTGCYTVVKSIL